MARAASKSAAPPRPYIRDPLAVIPIKPDEVDVRRDSRGMIHLRLTTTPTGWLQKIAVLFRYNFARTLELDEYGTHYYDCVDGTTTLATIIKRMEKKLNTDRKTTEESVMLFTKKLMTMNMIALKVPESALARRSDEQ